MGLDFGFIKISKKLWESFEGDKKKFYEYFSWDSKHDNEIEYLSTWCGRGNPIEKWMRDGLEYYDDYDGVLMRPLTPSDLCKAMQIGKQWYDNHLDLKPVVMGKAFNEYTNEKLGVTTTVLKNITGIEVQDEDDSYHRFYIDESDGRLFISKTWVDPWDIYKFPDFVQIATDLMLHFDWDDDVLLYFVSY